MSVGPCGMVCTSCQEFLGGRCSGCVQGDSCLLERAAASPCVVVRCAAARSVPYCLRDCADFPCDLYIRGRPFCQTRAATHDRRVPFPVDGSCPSRPELPADGYPSPSNAPLRVYTLGQFRVFVGDREIRDADWRQRGGATEKVKALFAVLVARNSHGARSEALTDLLWPEQTDPCRAMSNLHVAMHSLRNVLEPARAKSAESHFIRFDGLRYRLVGHDVCWTDADAFERHCGLAASAERLGDTPTAIEQWTLATALYAGDYMTGIRAAYTEDGVYEWCLPRREDLRGRYLSALVRLSEAHANQGDADTGLRLARQALQVDPECEEAHHIAAQCLVTTGQVAAAQVERRSWAAKAEALAARRPALDSDRRHPREMVVAFGA